VFVFNAKTLVETYYRALGRGIIFSEISVRKKQKSLKKELLNTYLGFLVACATVTIVVKRF